MRRKANGGNDVLVGEPAASGSSVAARSLNVTASSRASRPEPRQNHCAAVSRNFESKNAESSATSLELVKVREHLQRVLDHTPVVIYSLKIEGAQTIPTWVSDNIERLLGFKATEALHPDWWLAQVHPEDREFALADLQNLVTAGRTTAQYRLRHQQGHYIWVERTHQLVRNETGQPIEVAGIWSDITQRRQFEERLREQAELLDNASDAILVKDLEGRIQYWNRSAERLFGWTAAEALGRVDESFLDNDTLTIWQVRQALLKHGEWTGELRKSTKAGGVVAMQCRWTLLRDTVGQPKAILSIGTDITERKKLETQFLRAQRMESIGTLASGIAHDLNNVLTPILMALSLLREKVTDPEGLQFVDSLAKNVKRGSHIVGQVLAFGRGMRGERVPVDPRHLLHEVQHIIRQTFPKLIRLEMKVDAEIWNITGDPTQLHQVLLNLCINARDAMPNGGRLGLTVRNVSLDETGAMLDSTAGARPFVMFEISDSGEGIAPEIRKRIFEPFFTTKEAGRGTGLGLSTTAAILKSHGGFIEVESEVGHGSVFKAYLPATTLPADESAPPSAQQLPRGNGQSILLVDDEELILDVVSKTLERFGYHVLKASDGAVAVGLYAQHRDKIAVVLTDMTMPIMDGPATIRALRQINPDVAIVAASGSGSEAGMAKAIESGVNFHLRKPYATETMLGLLRQLIPAVEPRKGSTDTELLTLSQSQAGFPAFPPSNSSK